MSQSTEPFQVHETDRLFSAVKKAWNAFQNTKYQADRLRFELEAMQSAENKAYRDFKIIFDRYCEKRQPVTGKA